MNTLEITLGSMLCREFCEVDWDGEVIPRNKSTNYMLEIPFIITGKEPTSEFSLMTTVLAKIPRGGLPQETRSAESTILSLAAVQLSKDFGRRRSWRTFGEEKLLLDPVEPANIVTADRLETTPISVQVHPELYEQLAADGTTLARTNNVYTKAKDRLFNLACSHNRYELSDRASEIRTLLSFVETCNQRSADSYMAAWYAEKTPRVRRGFEDLFRRKNTSHPGYERSAESASDALYGFSAPYTYRETPPSPQQAEEFLK